MTREEAIALAQTTAWLYRDSHSYLPATLEESKNWVPHEWVITAMIAANIRMPWDEEDEAQKKAGD